LLKQYGIVVWWATPIEMCSTFERLLRTSELTVAEHTAARRRLEELRQVWREVQPSEPLRSQAETLLDRFPLKAADALQLAAALLWSSGAPQHCVLLSGDVQLLEAARHLGFQTVATS
jgi:predicted nucleic acid-binding protein